MGNVTSGEQGRITTENGGAITFANTSSSTERMRIDSSGNVGIGTSSISGRLIVASTSTDVANYYNGTRFVLQNQSATAGNFTDISFSSANGNDYAALWGICSSHTAGSTSGSLVFGTANAGSVAIERMRITSTGNFLYATTTSPYNSGQFGSGYGTSYWTFGPQSGSGSFLVQNGSSANGVYIVAGNTSWTGTSDGRLKNITGSIKNGLEKVLSMNPVKFVWKNSENTEEHIGFIAQEMEQIEPIVVQTELNGNKGITYTELIPILVAAIQELSAKVAALEGKA